LKALQVARSAEQKTFGELMTQIKRKVLLYLTYQYGSMIEHQKATALKNTIE